MRSFIWIFLIVIGALVVFYLSWIYSPRFEYNQFVPSWLARWADKEENYNTRTALPLFFLGIISGLFLMFKKMKLRLWLYTWLILTLVVLIAELGQFLLPLRSSDWKDVYWGSLGAAIGLLVTYLFKFILNIKRNLNVK